MEYPSVVIRERDHDLYLSEAVDFDKVMGSKNLDGSHDIENDEYHNSPLEDDLSVQQSIKLGIS